MEHVLQLIPQNLILPQLLIDKQQILQPIVLQLASLLRLTVLSLDFLVTQRFEANHPTFEDDDFALLTGQIDFCTFFVRETVAGTGMQGFVVGGEAEDFVFAEVLEDDGGEEEVVCPWWETLIFCHEGGRRRDKTGTQTSYDLVKGLAITTRLGAEMELAYLVLHGAELMDSPGWPLPTQLVSRASDRGRPSSGPKCSGCASPSSLWLH